MIAHTHYIADCPSALSVGYMGFTCHRTTTAVLTKYEWRVDFDIGTNYSYFARKRP